MNKNKRYKFTNKKHPRRAVMSTMLGLIAVVAYVIAIMLAFQERGEIGAQMGIVGLLGMIYSLVGLYLGIASRFEKEKFYLFSYVGIVVNVIALAMVVLTLYLGV